MKPAGNKTKTMKHLTTILSSILLILFIHHTAVAQQKRGDRVHALKVGYLTEKVQLTASQAEQFWPLYKAYENDLRVLRKQFVKTSKQQMSGLSEAEARKYVEDNLDYQDALVDLKRSYKDRFLKIISAQQLARLYAAEREFRQMLIQKLREKR